MNNPIGTWLKDVGGSMMLPFAVACPVAILLVGIGVDMARVQGVKASLQEIADNGALFAAQEFSVSSNNNQRIESVALSYVKTTAEHDNVAAKAVVDQQALTVTVTLSADPKTYFANPLSSVEAVEVSAVAQLVGNSGNVCLISLEEQAARTIELRERSKLTAETCGLYANSTSSISLRVNARADISIDQMYLAGGYSGHVNGLSSEPVTDAPPIDDPLANRPAPDVGTCDYNNFIYDIDSSGPIEPGVYCGGLHIDDQTVQAEPGIYIIKDGSFTIHKDGGIVGTDVGFYLTGKSAKLDFGSDSTLSLEAPRVGPMAGLLFFADINNPLDKKMKEGTGLTGGHVIRSDDARRLVGTIYLPDDKLVIDGESPLADESEYTIIIARAFELENGPHLVIRTDYAASNVPVPDGIGPVNDGRVFLVD